MKNEFREKLLLGILGSLTGIVAFMQFATEKISALTPDNINLSFVEKIENRLIYENDTELADAWLCTQGQIVIKTKNNVIVKTFIVSDMYEPQMHIIEKKKFEICAKKSSLADALTKELHEELSQQLIKRGYNDDEIVIEKIGLVCIDTLFEDNGEWTPFYYILEGESLTKIDENTAQDKMYGVKIDDNFFDTQNQSVKDDVMAETTCSILEELEK